MVAVTGSDNASALMRALRLIVLMGGPIMAGMVQLAILPAMPGMAAHFSALGQDGPFVAQNVTTIAAPAMALGAPLMGWLGGVLGKRLVLLVSMVAFGLFGVAGAFAPELYSLLATRLLLGVAAAGYVTLSVALIADYYPDPDARGRLLGWFAVVGGGGSLVVLQAAGILTKMGDWLTPFGLYAVAFPLFLLGLFVITPPRTAEDAQAAGDGSNSIWSAWTIYVLIILISISMYAATIQGPFLMTEVGITDAVVQSNVLLLTTVGSMVGAYIYRYVRPAMGFHLTLALTWAALALANIGFAATASAVLLAAFAFATGLGSGLMQPLTQTAVLSSVAPAVASRAVGVAVGCIFAGQFIHPFVVNPLRTALGLQPAFVWLGVASLVIGVLSALWGLRNARRRVA